MSAVRFTENEREDPGEPVIRGEVDRGVPQQPLISEEAQEAEEHLDAGADDAATQAVDGVGEMVVLRSPDAVDDELQHDGRYKYRHRESHRPAVSDIHAPPGRHHNAGARRGYSESRRIPTPLRATGR